MAEKNTAPTKQFIEIVNTSSFKRIAERKFLNGVKPILKHKVSVN